MKRRLHKIVAVSICALAVFALLESRHAKHGLPDVRSVSSSLESANQQAPNQATEAGSLSGAYSSSREVMPSPQPASASQLAAYPELTSRVSDWKQFNREAKSITVAPYPDLPLTFTRTGVKDEGRYVTWYGTQKEIPGSSLVAVATPGGGQTVVLIMPGSSQFTFYTAPDGTTSVSESQPGEEGCSVGGGLPDRTTAQAPASSALFKAQYTAASNYMGNSSEVLTGAPQADSSTLLVGVLVIYDPDIIGYVDSTDTTKTPATADIIDGRSKAYIESGNVVLTNSAVTNFQWKYLGSIAAKTYTEDTVTVDSSGTHGTLAITQISPGGAIGDWVTTQAYNAGAAQVVRWVSRHGTDMPYTGQANTGGKGIAVTASMARAAVLWGASYKSIIHELGHNFGCQHDRANVAVGGTGMSATDGDGFYSYGMLWTVTDPNYPKFPNQTASTIMGYGSAIIPYYSNPNISVHITGALASAGNSVDLGTKSLGLPVGDPKAAYNAKVLTDNASTLAGYGSGVSTPTITSQPQSVSVLTGSSFSLSVTATGGGLSYQWGKDGVSISGATASVYTKTSVSGDGGNYTVTITNTAGSVTSNSATVTITTQSSSGSGSSGGGGGGGAPSDPFFATIILVSLIRLIQRHHRAKCFVDR